MRGMDAARGTPLSGIEHLRQSIMDILTTPVGSRVMRRDYGSRLPELIDRPVNAAFAADLYAETAAALHRWEPRFRLSRVRMESATSGTVTLTVEGSHTPDGRPITLEGIVVS